MRLKGVGRTNLFCFSFFLLCQQATGFVVMLMIMNWLEIMCTILMFFLMEKAFQMCSLQKAS